MKYWVICTSVKSVWKGQQVVVRRRMAGFGSWVLTYPMPLVSVEPLCINLCYSEMFFCLCQQAKMPNSLFSSQGPAFPLAYTETCQKSSPWGQYVYVNEKRIKPWVKIVMGFKICSPFGACCDLCTELLLATVRVEILTLLNRIFIFSAAWSYSV